MPQESLKQTLQSLHEELSAGAPVDPEVRAEAPDERRVAPESRVPPPAREAALVVDADEVPAGRAHHRSRALTSPHGEFPSIPQTERGGPRAARGAAHA